MKRISIPIGTAARLEVLPQMLEPLRPNAVPTAQFIRIRITFSNVAAPLLPQETSHQTVRSVVQKDKLLPGRRIIFWL